MPPVITPGSIADLGGSGSPANAVLITGNQTVGGVKTFTSDPVIPDEAYHATNWNGVLEPPTKNAVRDQFESLVEISADDPTELDIAADGVITILSTIARQADLLTTNLYLPVFARKTADQDITLATAEAIGTGSSTSPALTLTLLASTTYEFTGQFGYDGPATANDLTFTFTFPSGATVQWVGQGPATGSTSMAASTATEWRWRTSGTSGAYGGAGAGTNGAVKFQGTIITTNAGTVTVTANHTAGPDATPFSILAGSYLVCRKVA